MYYPVTEQELNQIKNDCLYPDKPNCDGCECAEGVDNTRSSGVGCTFIGANLLMDKVIHREPCHQSVDALVKELTSERKDALKRTDTSFIDNRNYWDGFASGIKLCIEKITAIRSGNNGGKP